MSYKKSNWVPYDPTLSFEQNVTQGGTTTADKLNNMETGISNAFDKTSDTIGGRNLLINTAQLDDSTVCLDRISNISDTYLGLNIYQANTPWMGVRIHWPYLLPKIKTNTNYVMSEYVRNTSPTTSASIFVIGFDTGVDTEVVFNSRINYAFVTLPPNSGWTRISSLVNIASLPTKMISTLRFENATNLTDGYVQFAGLKLERGSVATDWTPAPEDKVNVSNMRKPASDVAGVEEVNAKQDKIAYTPADDSKVVHTTDTSNWQKNKVTNDDGTPFVDLNSSSQDLSATLMSLSTGLHTVYANALVVNNPFNGVSSAKGVIDIQGNQTGSNAFGEGFLIGTNMYYVWLNGSKANYTKIADDSKVAHLSGANNFDTVPTVNSKPVATTDDVATASNTVLTSANTSISKLLQSSSNNDEDSAVTNSTSDTSNFYYWTE